MWTTSLTQSPKVIAKSQKWYSSAIFLGSKESGTTSNCDLFFFSFILKNKQQINVFFKGQTINKCDLWIFIHVV